MNYESVPDLIQIVEESVSKAQNLRSKIPAEVANMRGFSSPKIRHLLNNLNSYGPHTYLEIGTYGGSTFIPSLYDNDVHGIGIDDWSQFGPRECADGYNAREDLNRNLLNWGGRFKTYEIMNRNCFGFKEEERPQSHVFLYDGAHEEAPTELAIRSFGLKNKHPFILIVDDYELAYFVSIGTEKALRSFEVHKEWELPKDQDWHMGVAIYVLEPKK